MQSSSSVSIRFIAPVKLAFVRKRGPYTQCVPEAWRILLAWLDARGHIQTADRGYGLAHDDPQTTLPDQIRYDAAVAMPPTWHEEDARFVRVKHFDGGAYTVQRHVGSYAGLGRIVSHVRHEEVPRKGLRLDPARPLLCIYHSDPRVVAPAEQLTDICLPIDVERRLDERD